MWIPLFVFTTIIKLLVCLPKIKFDEAVTFRSFDDCKTVVIELMFITSTLLNLCQWGKNTLFCAKSYAVTSRKSVHSLFLFSGIKQRRDIYCFVWSWGKGSRQMQKRNQIRFTCSHKQKDVWQHGICWALAAFVCLMFDLNYSEKCESEQQRMGVSVFVIILQMNPYF